MSADLETRIRETLHADDLTVADLHHPELRPRRPRRTGQVFAVAAAMAAVVAVAVGLTATVGHHGGDTAARGNGSLTGVVGYRWQVVRLSDPFGSESVPASPHAQIGFTRNGFVVGNDTVNALGGKYRSTIEGYTVRHAGTTFVGSAGISPQQKRTVAAVDVMFFDVHKTGATPTPVKVGVSLHGDTLTLRRGAFTLTLRRAGAQREPVVGTASSTPTKTR